MLYAAFTGNSRPVYGPSAETHSSTSAIQPELYGWCDDDYNIDESVLNSRQKPHFEKVKKQIHQFMETCPSSIVTIVGFTDKPGSEEHNFGLGQRRADHMKFLLELDLIEVNFRGMPPAIFARSEGEANPVDPAAGEKFSAKNRRIEIEFNSICPPLGSPSLTKPLIDTPLRIGFGSNS